MIGYLQTYFGDTTLEGVLFPRSLPEAGSLRNDPGQENACHKPTDVSPISHAPYFSVRSGLGRAEELEEEPYNKKNPRGHLDEADDDEDHKERQHPRARERDKI